MSTALKKTIVTIRDLELTHETQITHDISEVIENTILGNPKGIQYALVDAVNKAHNITPIHFFPLRRNNMLIYVMALAERLTFYKNREYPTYYVRYVSFHPNYTVNTLTRNTEYTKIQKLGNSIMKKGMVQYAQIIPFNLNIKAPCTKKVFYAYVEESNLRSMQFTQFFFSPIRTISVTTFSSFFPKQHPNFEILDLVNNPDLTAKIKSHFSAHSFFFSDKNNLEKQYYVLKDDNEILVGLQAEPAQWEIKHLPGILGKILMKIVPYIPILKRIFHKNLFTYLTFDTLYSKPGSEYLFPALFRSVCSAKKVYAAMIYLDKQDPLFENIREIKPLGLLNKLYKGANVTLMARFVNLTEEEIQDYYDRPAYVSGFDLC